VKRHELDPVSLLFGSIFFLIGGVFLVGGTSVPDLHFGRLWPIPLIALGVLIVLMAARALVIGAASHGSRRDEQPPD
jgi:hypothetical protein